MKVDKMKNVNPLYQNIGDELKLGVLSFVDVIQTLLGGYGELVRLKFQNKSIIKKYKISDNSTR